MAYAIPRTTKEGTGEIVYLERHDIVISSLRCPKCGSTISISSSDRWLSLKCKCQCALVYPDSYPHGRMDVISRERHQKKKESMKNEQTSCEKET